MSDWAAFFEELRVPAGAAQSPVARAGTACGHLVAGAALGLVAGHFLSTLFAALVVAGAYLATKEFADLRAGGDWRDGLIDTCFVGLGALAGAWSLLWPFALAAAAADGVYGKTWRR